MVNEKIRVHELFRNRFKLEDFINYCLENLNTDFIDEAVNPDLQNNSITIEQEEKVTKLARALYTTIHLHIEEALDHNDRLIPSDKNNNAYNLVGFLATSAIIGIGEDVLFDRDAGDRVRTNAPRYPSFEESYGDLRIAKWRNEIITSPVLQTFIPIIGGVCSPPATF